MSQDTKSGRRNANSGGKLSDNFNKDQERESRIAALGPDERKIVDEMKRNYQDQMEDEAKGQARHHTFRVMKVEIQNLQAAVRNPDRPASVSVEDAIKLAHDDAEEIVTHREAYHLSRLEQDHNKIIDTYLRRVERPSMRQTSLDVERDIED